MVRSNLQKSTAAIVLVIAMILFGTLLNFGWPNPSEAYTKTKNTTTDLPSDLFADQSVNNGIDRALPASTTTAAIDIVKSNTPNHDRDSGKAWVRLPGEVPSALSGATKLPERMAADAPLTLTIILKHADQAGFDRYFKDVYDQRSPSFRHFLSQREITARFGPTQKAYGAVLDYLRRNGFTLVQGSENRLTLTVRGTRARAERAFKVNIQNFERGGQRFFSNDQDPALPQSLASNVLAVTGLSNLAVPRPSHLLAANLGSIANLTLQIQALLNERAVALANLFDPGHLAFFKEFDARIAVIMEKWLNISFSRILFPPVYDPSVASKDPQIGPSANTDMHGSANGAGQKIGVVAFSSFSPNDVANWLALAGLSSTLLANVSQVHINGGAPRIPDEEGDVLVGIETILGLAPGAQVAVYDAPFAGPGTSFQTLFNAMVNDHVTIISNSFNYCEDQTTLADVQSIDAILKSAAASGISVFNATGDTGSVCRDGSANTITVPADSPNATAVGGTSMTVVPGLVYGGETWWDGLSQVPPTGQGGYGVSRFFGRPDYQNGFIVGPMRSVPDVVTIADPHTGARVCQADLGRCPTPDAHGGTSLATPIWAAMTALLNEKLQQPLGLVNARFYSLAGTNAFHSAASMGTDLAHVGVGSPNVDLLYLALTGQAPGSIDPSISSVKASLLYINLLSSIPADGKSAAAVVVRLRDANSNIVPGKTVTLSPSTGSHAVITPASGVSSVAGGDIVFTITDATPETVTFTATAGGVRLNQTATISFGSPPATAGGISANPTTVNANGSDTTTITVTLQEENGKPSPGKVVNLSQGNGSSIISGTTATTDATGKVQFTAVDNVAETVTYTALDVSDGNLPVPGSATVSFVNASGFCSSFGHYGIGTAAPGYAVTTFASNFPVDCFLNIGPIGLVFNASGNLLVGDRNNQSIYLFGPQGGTAGPATLLGTVQDPGGVTLLGLTFTKDGRLYGASQNPAKIVEVNPATGTEIRIVVFPAPSGALAVEVDPLSGDLFFSTGDGIFRVTNFANGPGTVTPYCSRAADGIKFAPDGTLYAAAGDAIIRVSGTNAPTPGTVTTLAFLPGHPDGIELEPNAANASKPFLYVNRNDGTITRID
ncbi:MAG: hypothetical protein DMF74_21910, partial [Acidobacteria bacterium]